MSQTRGDEFYKLYEQFYKEFKEKHQREPTKKERCKLKVDVFNYYFETVGIKNGILAD